MFFDLACRSPAARRRRRKNQKEDPLKEITKLNSVVSRNYDRGTTMDTIRTGRSSKTRLLDSSDSIRKHGNDPLSRDIQTRDDAYEYPEWGSPTSQSNIIRVTPTVSVQKLKRNSIPENRKSTDELNYNEENNPNIQPQPETFIHSNVNDRDAVRVARISRLEAPPSINVQNVSKDAYISNPRTSAELSRANSVRVTKLPRKSDPAMNSANEQSLQMSKIPTLPISNSQSNMNISEAKVTRSSSVEVRKLPREANSVSMQASTSNVIRTTNFQPVPNNSRISPIQREAPKSKNDGVQVMKIPRKPSGS